MQQNILKFAITREQKAHEFYQDLARQTDHPLKRMLFERFAQEELSHMQRLQSHLSLEELVGVEGSAAPLLDDDSPEQLTPQLKEKMSNVIANAMQKEKSSFRLYMDMALKISNESARETLMALAKDEANHQALLEMEFDRLSDGT